MSFAGLAGPFARSRTLLGAPLCSSPSLVSVTQRQGIRPRRTALPLAAPRQEDLVAHLIERFGSTEAQRRPEDDIDRDPPKRALPRSRATARYSLAEQQRTRAPNRLLP